MGSDLHYYTSDKRILCYVVIYVHIGRASVERLGDIRHKGVISR